MEHTFKLQIILSSDYTYYFIILQQDPFQTCFDKNTPYALKNNLCVIFIQWLWMGTVRTVCVCVVWVLHAAWYHCLLSGLQMSLTYSDKWIQRKVHVYHEWPHPQIVSLKPRFLTPVPGFIVKNFAWLFATTKSPNLLNNVFCFTWMFALHWVKWCRPMRRVWLQKAFFTFICWV